MTPITARLDSRTHEARISPRARVLVHGATGFTGRLVCDALRRRGIAFAVSGRSRDRLDVLAARYGNDLERYVIDVARPETLRHAIEKRAIVCACAGPFVDVGEPVVETCASLGVHYVDTTGEQRFVAAALHHDATARASGACIVPSMGYETAPADWAASLAAARLGGPPDEVALYYEVTGDNGRLFGTSRATKRSALRILESGGCQWLDGALVEERPGSVVRTFEWGAGECAMAASFPTPDPILVPSHTRARTVRSFVVLGSAAVRVLRATRWIAPTLARVGGRWIEQAIGRSAEGPDANARSSSSFRILCESIRGDRRERILVHGRDPYGLTGELVAFAASRAVGGSIVARGVVAPSVAFPAQAAFDARGELGFDVD